MRFLILLLLGLCISAATSRPSQTDDDDGQVRETEYEAGDGEYIQEEKGSLKSDNQRSYDDEAEETEDYYEPDSEDPAVKNNRQFLGAQKASHGDILKDDRSQESGKEEAITHNKKSNMYKRTSRKEENMNSEPTPDVTLKEKLLKNYRDQSRSSFDTREEALQRNKDSMTQVHGYEGKVSDKKLENDRNRRETDSANSAEKVGKKRSNKRDTSSTFDTNDSFEKKNNKDFSRKDLEDLLSSLSIEKINILKTLINDNENISKRDIAKKSNADDGDKSTDDGRINVRENQEKCHSSIPSPCDSEIPHSIHSLNTCPPPCEIKIPKPCDMCNLTTPRAELSDTDANQDKTHSKENKFMDESLTDIMDMKNENNKEMGVSDLTNIANLESFYDFSEHHKSYKETDNGHTDDYSEFQNYDSKILKRETLHDRHGDSSLEDSFPKGYVKFNSDSELEPLVRVKRTEGQHLEENSEPTCKNTQDYTIGNINFATDKMSIGSDTDNILSNNAQVESTLMNDKSRGKREEDKKLISDPYDACDTNLGYDKLILGDNDELASMNKESVSRDVEIDSLGNMRELKDVNRYKRIRQVNEEKVN